MSDGQGRRFGCLGLPSDGSVHEGEKLLHSPLNHVSAFDCASLAAYEARTTREGSRTDASTVPSDEGSSWCSSAKARALSLIAAALGCSTLIRGILRCDG